VKTEQIIRNLSPEHGLSVIFKTADRKLLFDLGASDIFLQNAKRMKIDLRR
jgi:7,8-dihydropterin-6-yl-methyl-4-(beta-D-ribofuranosyl)aminobenzene 5'-phosphate synthase